MCLRLSPDLSVFLIVTALVLKRSKRRGKTHTLHRMMQVLTTPGTRPVSALEVYAIVDAVRQSRMFPISAPTAAAPTAIGAGTGSHATLTLTTSTGVSSAGTTAVSLNTMSPSQFLNSAGVPSSASSASLARGKGGPKGAAATNPLLRAAADASLAPPVAALEVALLKYLEPHGAFIAKQQQARETSATAATTDGAAADASREQQASSSSGITTPAAAAKAATRARVEAVDASLDIASGVFGELLSAPKAAAGPSSSAGDAASTPALRPGGGSGALAHDEIRQLMDLRAVSELDAYRVVPDLESRLGSEEAVALLLQRVMGRLRLVDA
jgi:hypothetical protein